MNIKNALLNADVTHKRLLPKINQFVYSVFYICFNLDDIKKLNSLFFSLNQFNIFSFYNKDHGNKTKENPEIWAQKILKENSISADKIFLLAHPRILGFVFNPVSFWFCLNKNEELIAVIAEVNNTFKETHSYLIYDKENKKIDEDKLYQATKEFHVSPFMKRIGFYRFRFIFKPKKIFVSIDYFNDEGEKMLLTSLSGKRTNLTNISLIKNFLFIPFVTLKVVFLIHFQALKLVLKRIKYIPKPEQLKHKLTKIK